jgi:hypothetical protein
MGFDPNQAEQMTRMTVQQGVSWAQIFYYSMAGLAGLAMAIKTYLVIRKRRKNA